MKAVLGGEGREVCGSGCSGISFYYSALFVGQLSWAFMKTLGAPCPTEGFPRRDREGPCSGDQVLRKGNQVRRGGWLAVVTLRPVCGDR